MNNLTKIMLREISKFNTFETEWFWHKEKELIRLIGTYERCYLMELSNLEFIKLDNTGTYFLVNKDKINEVLNGKSIS